MRTSVIITEVKKIADYLEAQNIYNDGESAFEAAIKIMQLEVDVLYKADQIIDNIKWLEEAVPKIIERQDV